MQFFIPRTIKAFISPKHQLSCSTMRWKTLLNQLRYRSDSKRESGAFLLGKIENGRRRILDFSYYDDLYPPALDGGFINFDGQGYKNLSRLCRDLNLTVVADIHTHPGSAIQSYTDRQNPMNPTAGHIGIIIPNYAKEDFSRNRIKDYGLYLYQGRGNWKNLSGVAAKNHFYIGAWG